MRDWLKLKGSCPLCKHNVFDTLKRYINNENPQHILDGVELSDLELVNNSHREMFHSSRSFSHNRDQENDDNYEDDENENENDESDDSDAPIEDNV